VRNDDEGKRPMKMRAMRWISAAAIVAAGATGAGCGKRLTEETCDKVIDHLIEVLKTEFKGAMKACPDDMQKIMKSAVDKGMDDSKDQAASQCKAEAKQSKVLDQKEYDCFMAGKSVKDWKDCKFSDKGSFSSFDDELDKAISSLKDTCDKAGGGKKKSSDDDDDKGSKKKKSSDDDDDKGSKKKKKDSDD
jgi:hypothetical protein